MGWGKFPFGVFSEGPDSRDLIGGVFRFPKFWQGGTPSGPFLGKSFWGF